MESDLNEQDLLGYKKTMKALLLFSGYVNSISARVLSLPDFPPTSWISTTLGHVPSQAAPQILGLGQDHVLEEENTIQQEITKITTIKANIVRSMSDTSNIVDATVGHLREELRAFHQQLPSWMAITGIPQVQVATSSRQLIYYLHLFYLSAMTLLHCRIMAARDSLHPSTESQHAKAAIRDGLVAAKINARILGMIHKDGSIIELWWMCMSASLDHIVVYN